MLKAVFFDLDGTLLPLDEDQFVNYYFKLLCDKLYPLGYEPKQLIATIWRGCQAMYQNDGSFTNEAVFWQAFQEAYGLEKMSDKPIFDEFYATDFLKTRAVCHENPLAKKIVNFCKEANLEVYLTTNPIFPLQATLNRMSFVGLDKTDFKYITSYENSYFTKPNANYFQSIMTKFNLKPNEVILFGNNSYEDGECALAAGIKCYLVGDYIIDHPKATQRFRKIRMEDVIPIIKKELIKNR